MFVLLVWANRMECLHAEDAYDCAENVRLFEVEINKICRLLLDEVDGLGDMYWL